jgi:hypothetical protein
MINNQHIRNIRQQLRKERQLSLNYFAVKLKIDYFMFSEIENGDKRIQRFVIRALKAVFKLNYKDIQIQLLSEKC